MWPGLQLSERYGEEIEVFKEEARNMLISGGSKLSPDKLVLIETIDRLGLSYHFEKEIQEQLTMALDNGGYENQENDDDDDDLYTVALYFRLLRLRCFDVPSCKCFPSTNTTLLRLCLI